MSNISQSSFSDAIGIALITVATTVCSNGLANIQQSVGSLQLNESTAPLF